MPDTPYAFERIDHIAAMIKGNGLYSVWQSGESDLIVFERMVKSPIALEGLKPLQRRDPHFRADNVFLLVWHPDSPKQPDDFFHRPHVIRNACFHRWRHAERLMHAGEIVEHEVESDGCGVVRDLL